MDIRDLMLSGFSKGDKVFINNKPMVILRYLTCGEDVYGLVAYDLESETTVQVNMSNIRSDW